MTSLLWVVLWTVPWKCLCKTTLDFLLLHYHWLWFLEAPCSYPEALSSLTVVLLLGLQQTVPMANLLSFWLLHLSPVGELLLSRAVEAKRDPADHLLALHAALVVDGEDKCDVRQLEKSYLEDKRLFVGRVGLTSTDGCLTLGHLVAHGVQ